MQKYEKDLEYSYTLGLFPTFELLTNCAPNVEKLIFSTKLIKTQDVGNLIALAEKLNVPIETNDKLINKLSPKENCFVIGVFKKFKKPFTKAGKQLVLVSPSDMGNLGTIFRTALGFGFTNINLIKPRLQYLLENKTERAAWIDLMKSSYPHEDKEDVITTEYEDKFIAKGNVIYFVEVINNGK